jgi:hypothetical protein
MTKDHEHGDTRVTGSSRSPLSKLPMRSLQSKKDLKAASGAFGVRRRDGVPMMEA